MSKSMASSLLVLLEIVLLVISGCVELTSQRISWFYDAPKDELRILIHYDGIHDSGDDTHDEGVKQVREFVKNGDVMFRDWAWHLEMADLRRQLHDPNTKALEKDEARLFTSIKTEPAGYYREPDGRMGAAQLVTITEAKAFIRKLNGLISRQGLEDETKKDDVMTRTQERMHAAAKDNYQWFTIEGHALRVTLPVHPDEWLRAKGRFLEDLVKEIVKAGEEAVDDEKIAIIQALSSVPVSYIESADRVTFVLGLPKTPSTLRMKLEDEYEPSLEKVVVETVKVDLDKALAEMLLDKDAKPSALLSAVRSFGPPEEQVRALMVAAQNGDDKQKKAAIERLASWAKRWNRDHGVPKAPKMRDKLENYIAAWKKWYGQMRQYPIFKEKDDAAEAQ